MRPARSSPTPGLRRARRALRRAARQPGSRARRARASRRHPSRTCRCRRRSRRRRWWSRGFKAIRAARIKKLAIAIAVSISVRIVPDIPGGNPAAAQVFLVIANVPIEIAFDSVVKLHPTEYTRINEVGIGVIGRKGRRGGDATIPPHILARGSLGIAHELTRGVFFAEFGRIEFSELGAPSLNAADRVGADKRFIKRRCHDVFYR